jgi:bacterioferritin-associated ferredoxin
VNYKNKRTNEVGDSFVAEIDSHDPTSVITIEQFTGIMYNCGTCVVDCRAVVDDMDKYVRPLSLSLVS